MCCCGARIFSVFVEEVSDDMTTGWFAQIYCGSTDRENCDGHNGPIGSVWPRNKLSARGNTLFLQVVRSICPSCLTKKHKTSVVSLVSEFVCRFGVSLQLHSDQRTKCSLMDWVDIKKPEPRSYVRKSLSKESWFGFTIFAGGRVRVPNWLNPGNVFHCCLKVKWLGIHDSTGQSDSCSRKSFMEIPWTSIGHLGIGRKRFVLDDNHWDNMMTWWGIILWICKFSLNSSSIFIPHAMENSHL